MAKEKWMAKIYSYKSTWIVLSCVVEISSLKAKGNQGLRWSLGLRYQDKGNIKRGEIFSQIFAIEKSWRKKRGRNKE